MTAQQSEEEKGPRISVRVEPYFKDLVEQWAKQEGRPLANFVRWWLEQYPKKEKPDQN